MESNKNNISDTKHIGDLIAENIDGSADNSPIIPSLFKDFDNKFRGFTLGDFVVIGGSPAMGKSFLAICFALQISEKHSVLFYSFKQTESNLIPRFMSSFSCIPLDKLLLGQLTEEEEDRLQWSKEQLQEYNNLRINCTVESFEDFKESCIQNILEHKVKVIFIDGLQGLRVKEKLENGKPELNYICEELRLLTRKYGVCIIATSQLNKNIENRPNNEKRPYLSDLWGNGAIEQEADKVMFLYRPEYYGITTDEDSNDIRCFAEIIMAKNRTGAIGTIILEAADDRSRYYRITL